MIVLWLVRCRETNISSATETRDSRMISAAKGSIFVLTAMLLNPRLDDKIADSIEATSLARVDHSGRGFLLDDRRALHFFIEGEALPLVERRLVDSVLIEVDPPPAFARCAFRCARGECGQVGIGDSNQAGQVQVDELHSSVEPEHEGALMALVESGRHVGERRLAIRNGNANRV